MTTPEGGDPFEGGLSISVSASEVSSLWAWLMAGFGMIALGTAIAGRLLPTVLGLDLLALWPVPAFALFVTVLTAVFRARGLSRVVGPLFLMTWLVLGVGWYLTGTLSPPSGAADIVGTDAVPDRVEVGISSVGEVAISEGAGPETYTIGLLDRGGAVGAPDVLEASENGAMAMTIAERTDSEWYRTAGWDIALHSSPAWRLDISASAVRLDLSGLTISGLSVDADGEVILGSPSGLVDVDLLGDVTLSVPFGSAVTIVGSADVPSSWLSTADGFRSPSPGEGYLVSSGGPGITIVER